MKKLYLLRHAKYDYYSSSDDMHRPLSPSGIMAAHALGKELKARNLSFDIIKCSTATRAMQTAEIVIKELGYDGEVNFDDNLYTFDAQDVLDVISEYDDSWQSLLIIGHNAALSELVWYLADDRPSIHLDTCNFAALQSDSNQWSDLAKGESCKLDYIVKPNF
ncbi:MAG: histidine phosphatase family protein [Bacteroidales bacterium]|nr:histidine phosphatase family protein [Bacteroidales bacterium]